MNMQQQQLQAAQANKKNVLLAAYSSSKSNGKLPSKERYSDMGRIYTYDYVQQQ
jgi:hypothetical protein